MAVPFAFGASIATYALVLFAACTPPTGPSGPKKAAATDQPYSGARL